MKKKITTHTDALSIASAFYKTAEVDVSPAVQDVQARIEMAAELLSTSGSKMKAALTLQQNLKCTLPTAYFYLSKAQEQEPELNQHTRKWFVWMLLEHAMKLAADLSVLPKRKHKEEIALVKVMSDLMEKHMGDKETIDMSKLPMPSMIVLGNLPEQVNSEWEGKSEREIMDTIKKVLNLDENPEDDGDEDTEFEEL